MAIVKTFVAAMDGADHAKFELLIYNLMQALKIGASITGQLELFNNCRDIIRFQLVSDMGEKFPPYLYITFGDKISEEVMFDVSSLKGHRGVYMKVEEAGLIKGFSLQHFATMIAMRLAQNLTWLGYSLYTPGPMYFQEKERAGLQPNHTWVWDFVPRGATLPELPILLWIDDEPKYVSSNVEELRKRYEGRAQVEFASDVDTAWAFFQEHKDRLKGVILDIMMPPGELFGKAPETEHGLRTGILLFEKMRQLASDLKVLVVSNVSDKEVVDRFSSAEPNCGFRAKKDYLPFELVTEAISFFN